MRRFLTLICCIIISGIILIGCKPSESIALNDTKFDFDARKCITPLFAVRKAANTAFVSNDVLTPETYEKGDLFGIYLRGDFRSLENALKTTRVKQVERYVGLIAKSCQFEVGTSSEFLTEAVNIVEMHRIKSPETPDEYIHHIESLNTLLELNFMQGDKEGISNIAEVIASLQACKTSDTEATKACHQDELWFAVRVLQFKALIFKSQLIENPYAFWTHMQNLEVFLDSRKTSASQVEWFLTSHPNPMPRSSLSLQSAYIFLLQRLTDVIYSPSEALRVTHPYETRPQYSLSENQHKRFEIKRQMGHIVGNVSEWTSYESAPLYWLMIQDLYSYRSLSTFEAPDGVELSKTSHKSKYSTYCGRYKFAKKVEALFRELKLSNPYADQCTAAHQAWSGKGKTEKSQ